MTSLIIIRYFLFLCMRFAVIKSHVISHMLRFPVFFFIIWIIYFMSKFDLFRLSLALKCYNFTLKWLLKYRLELKKVYKMVFVRSFCFFFGMHFHDKMQIFIGLSVSAFSRSWYSFLFIFYGSGHKYNFKIFYVMQSLILKVEMVATRGESTTLRMPQPSQWYETKTIPLLVTINMLLFLIGLSRNLFHVLPSTYTMARIT